MDLITFTKQIVPKKYQTASIEQYDGKKKEMMKNWAQTPISLYIHGQNGVGKTHFVFALLRHLMSETNQFWPRYFSGPDLDRRLLESMSTPGGETFEINSRASDDILFIDDFGRESNTDRLRRQYFEIINLRYINEMITIITSNISIQEMSELKDNAIASRMQEWRAIQLKGTDRRIKNI